jgi:hypothetical protein
MFSFIEEPDLRILKPDVLLQIDRSKSICEYLKLCYPVAGTEITRWRNIADITQGAGPYDIDLSVADFVSSQVSELGGYSIQSANSGGAGAPAPFTTFTVGRSFTLSFWISPIAGGPSYGTIFAQNASTGIYLRSTGAIDFFSTSDHNSTTTIPVGSWNHVVIRCFETTVTYHINGKKDATTFTGSANFTFNRVFNDASSEKLAAKIDLLTYWDFALSEGDVLSLYKDPLCMLVKPTGVDPSLLYIAAAAQGSGSAAGFPRMRSGEQVPWLSTTLGRFGGR